MKKFLSLLICLVFIFAIVSCSSNTSNKSENADNFSSDENVILDTVSNLDEPEGICPSGSHSKYLSTAIDEIPELLMTTSGFENGCPGKVYKFNGEVLDEGAIDNGMEYIIVNTEVGKVAIYNMYTIMESLSSTVFQELIEESGASYIFPDIGDVYTFYGIYGGFSDAVDLPCFYLGANEFILGTFFDDPSYLEENILTYLSFSPTEYNFERTENTFDVYLSFDCSNDECSAVVEDALNTSINAAKLFELDLAAFHLECHENGTIIFSWESSDYQEINNITPNDLFLQGTYGDGIDFFDSVERLNTYETLYKSYQFNEALQLLENYIVENSPDLNDNAYTFYLISKMLLPLLIILI